MNEYPPPLRKILQIPSDAFSHGCTTTPPCHRSLMCVPRAWTDGGAAGLIAVYSIADHSFLTPASHRPCTMVRICDECNYGSYEGRCVICGGMGISDAFYCKECTVLEKDRDGYKAQPLFLETMNCFRGGSSLPRGMPSCHTVCVRGLIALASQVSKHPRPWPLEAP